MEFNKIPPQDIEAEKSLLCCIMIDKYWHDKLEDNDILIKPEYFYYKQHHILFNIIENIYDKDITVDLITVREGLKRANELNTIKTSYLVEIMNQTSTSVAIVDYAKIVKEKYFKRNLYLIFFLSILFSIIVNISVVPLAIIQGDDYAMSLYNSEGKIFRAGTPLEFLGIRYTQESMTPYDVDIEKIFISNWVFLIFDFIFYIITVFLIITGIYIGMKNKINFN